MWCSIGSKKHTHCLHTEINRCCPACGEAIEHYAISDNVYCFCCNNPDCFVRPVVFGKDFNDTRANWGLVEIELQLMKQGVLSGIIK